MYWRNAQPLALQRPGLKFLDLPLSVYRILENYLTALSLICSMGIVIAPFSRTVKTRCVKGLVWQGKYREGEAQAGLTCLW